MIWNLLDGIFTSGWFIYVLDYKRNSQIKTKLGHEFKSWFGKTRISLLNCRIQQKKDLLWSPASAKLL